MFSVLAKLDINTKSTESLESTLLKSVEHQAVLTKDLYELKDLISSLEDLNALYTAIQKHGVSKSLLAFADHDNTLSLVCKELPSVESLTGATITNQSKIALEGLASTISDAISRAISKVKSAIGNMVDGLKLAFGSRKAMLSQIAKQHKLFEGKQFDTELAKTITIKTLTYANTTKRLNETKKLNPLIISFYKDKLPTSTEEYTVWFNKLHAAFVPYYKMLNMGDYSSADYTESIHTVSSAGYNAQSVDNLLKALSAWVANDQSTEQALIGALNYVLEHVDDTIDINTSTTTGTVVSNTGGATGSITTKNDTARVVCKAIDRLIEVTVGTYSKTFKIAVVRSLETIHQLHKVYK